jgi:hypothetical protein
MTPLEPPLFWDLQIIFRSLLGMCWGNTPLVIRTFLMDVMNEFKVFLPLFFPDNFFLLKNVNHPLWALGLSVGALGPRG